MSSSGPTIAQTESKSGRLDLLRRCGWCSFHWQVVNMVLPLVAIIVTTFRLYCRVRQRRLWIDDLWAALAMIFTLALFIVDWLYLQAYGEPCFVVCDTYHFLKMPRNFSSRCKGSTVLHVCSLILWCLTGIKTVLALGSANSFPQLFGTALAAWQGDATDTRTYDRCSRISILFTVVRLTVPGTLRKILTYTTIIFVIAWAVLSAQVWWTCESEPGWKTQPRPQCDLGRNVAIAQIISEDQHPIQCNNFLTGISADVFGDTILILAPFRLIYKVRLTKAQKIRILAIFSTSAITTIVSLAHSYYVLTDGGLKEAVAAMVEV
jgi:hypothetical protein